MDSLVEALVGLPVVADIQAAFIESTLAELSVDLRVEGSLIDKIPGHIARSSAT